jgi:hypothetical protein
MRWHTCRRGRGWPRHGRRRLGLGTQREGVSNGHYFNGHGTASVPMRQTREFGGRAEMTYRRIRLARWRCWRPPRPAPYGASIAAGLHGVTVMSVVREASRGKEERQPYPQRRPQGIGGARRGGRERAVRPQTAAYAIFYRLRRQLSCGGNVECWTRTDGWALTLKWPGHATYL